MENTNTIIPATVPSETLVSGSSEELPSDGTKISVVPANSTIPEGESPITDAAASEFLQKMAYIQNLVAKERARRRTLRKPKNFLAAKVKKRKTAKKSRKANRNR